MARMTRSEAQDVLIRCHAPRYVAFHALPSSVVSCLVAEADRVGYRQPRNANGSRARYFHARLIRAIEREES